MNACLTGSEHNARPTTSQSAFLRRKVADVFRKQIDLDARMSAILEIVALAASVHGPVIGGFRHERQDLRVNVVGKHPIEFEMEKRLLDRACCLDRLHDKIGQAVSCPAPVIG